MGRGRIGRRYRDRLHALRGADVERRPDPSVRKWGVQPNRYVLYVSRLEPENNARLVIEAFKRVRTAHKLLIVGDAPYAQQYIADLKAHAADDPRITFTGFVFGRDYKALQQNAYCYIHATEVGGTHPALLEAMEERQINLVLMGGYSVSALEEVIAGSAVNLMLREARCPLFICR